MSLSDAYSTPGLYRESLTKRDVGKDEDIQSDLLAISRYMEKKFHTFWNKDDEPVVRHYHAKYTPMRDGWAEAENPWTHVKGDVYLRPDPIATALGLEITIDTDRDNDYSDETPLGVNDYILLPRNALVGPEPSPYTEIVRSDHTIWAPASEIKIEAVWGWPAVPIIVQRVCNQLTGLLRFESPRARAITEIEGTMEASRDAQQILYTLQMALKRQPGFGMS